MSDNKKAPDFNLTDTNSDTATLQNYKGKKVVLLFFPLAFSRVCTQELCSTRDNYKIYEALNAEVLAISVDSKFALKAFKEAYNLNIRLLSDFNKDVSKSYGVLQDDFYGMKGVSKRAVFVIDENQEIIHQQVMDDASKLPDFHKVQDVLAAT